MHCGSRDALHRLLSCVLVASCSPVIGANLPEEPLQPELRLRVRIYAYARISNATLSRARTVASRILRLSGIEADWIECIVTPLDAPRDPRCRAKAATTDVVVRVLSHGAAAFKHRDEIGVAFIPADGAFGRQAAVFYDRIEDYAVRWQASEGILLGHVIAHELGHLLLGENSHAPSGIMSAPWTRDAIEVAGLGGLLFTKRQARSMREEVARRLRVTKE